MRRFVLHLVCVAFAFLLATPALAGAAGTGTADQVAQLQKAVTALQVQVGQQARQIQDLQSQTARTHALLTGSGAPAAALGAVGDLYLNANTYQIYGPKTCLGWGAPTSLKGPRGDTGATGPQGAKGDPGPAGPHGDKGATGDIGPAGKDGTDGAIGPQGEKGATGEVGPAGEDGKDGAPGAPGDQGDKGDSGATGLAGAKGDTGPQGPQGVPGPNPALNPAYAGLFSIAPYVSVKTGAINGRPGPNILISGANLFTGGESYGYQQLGLNYDSPPPQAPLGVSAQLQEIGSGTTLYWNFIVRWSSVDPAGCQSYRLYRGRSGLEPTELIATFSADDPPSFFDSAPPGETHKYGLTSVNQWGAESAMVVTAAIKVPKVDHFEFVPTAPGPVQFTLLDGVWKTQVQVRVCNPDGTTVTDFTGPVYKVASNGSPDFSSGVPAVNGVATFTYTSAGPTTTPLHQRFTVQQLDPAYTFAIFGEGTWNVAY